MPKTQPILPNRADETDGGIRTAGQSQGLVREISSCEDVVANLVNPAEGIMTDRLVSVTA